MSYTISYTDVANKGTITVEDGTINRETTLGFPGRNTTAYGATIAENFLHLLENFAATTEPSNPVEGQMWYDSTLGVESLKVYNGTNWIPASGISKSINTPSIAQTGDLWVDTDNQQLYLFTGGGWILVGPQFSEGLSTGARADQIVGQDNALYNVLRVEVAGTTVAIVNGADTAFIPKATIAGFSVINPGINLINRDTDSDGLSNFKFFGTAEKAENLIVSNEVIQAGNFLRGDTTSTTTFPLNIQNNQGTNIGVNAELTLGVEGSAGIIQHNIGGSNIDVRVRNNNVSKTVIRVDSNLRVGVNTEAPDEALDVVGNIQSSGSVIINDTTDSTTINNGALQVRGGAGIRQSLNVGGETELFDLLTTNSIVPDDNNIRDIGSPTRKYQNMYATTFTGNLVGNVSGTITGRSTESDKLTSRTTFIMEGDVSTVVPVEFDGQFQDPDFDNGVDGSGNPLASGEQPLQKKFRTEISNQFIAGKPFLSDVASNDLILFNDVEGSSPGLKSTTKENFLKTIPRNPAGVVMPYAGDNAPSGWLLCNGQELDKEDYQDLFAVIGYKFKPESQVTPGYFSVPDMRGRLPLGADNIGGSSADVVTAGSADIIGALDGAETKNIDVTNLPEHQHDLRDSDNNQFYAIQDRQDPTTDSNVSAIDAPTATGAGQKLSNSGDIVSSSSVGQPFNIMPPTVTMNYIIYAGRE
jgi:microcystin-dependent protein